MPSSIKEIEKRRAFIRAELASGEEKLDEAAVSPAKDFLVRQEGDTRQKIATWFVLGYFGIFLLILIGAPAYNSFTLAEPPAIDLEGLLQIFGGLIGTSLGFVVGYYFKSQQN